MSAEVGERLVHLIDASDGAIKTLDITGGAPELMAQFRPLVKAGPSVPIHMVHRYTKHTRPVRAYSHGVPVHKTHQAHPCLFARHVFAQRKGLTEVKTRVFRLVVNDLKKKKRRVKAHNCGVN